MNPIITLSTFDSSKISINDPELKKSGSFSYVLIPIKYDEKEMKMKLQGRLKIFQHDDKTTQKKNYSIGLEVDDRNRKMFKEMEEKIASLTEGKKSQVKKLNLKFACFHEEDLKIIKTNLTGEYSKVYSKLYTEEEIINCPFWEVIQKNKRQKLDPHSVIGAPMNGSIVISLKQVFLGNVKSITFITKEVLITEIIKPKSFFEDFEEVEENEEN